MVKTANILLSKGINQLVRHQQAGQENKGTTKEGMGLKRGGSPYEEGGCAILAIRGPSNRTEETEHRGSGPWGGGRKEDVFHKKGAYPTFTSPRQKTATSGQRGIRSTITGGEKRGNSPSGRRSVISSRICLLFLFERGEEGSETGKAGGRTV